MKLIILTSFVALFTPAFSQQVRDTLSVEFSPATYDYFEINYSIQGKLSYRFAEHFELNGIHNLSLTGKNQIKKDLSRHYKQNSYSYAGGSAILFEKHISSPEDFVENPVKFSICALKLDAGAFYSRYSTSRFADFFTYESQSNGEVKKISNISSMSLSTGLTFTYSRYKIYIRSVENKTVWLRNYHLSFGFLHGLNYYLNGFSTYQDNTKSVEPPRVYGFRKDGYYARFDFQQRISEHLFTGVDLLFYKPPNVQYQHNAAIYIPRGGEKEFPFKAYAALTIGYHF